MKDYLSRREGSDAFAAFAAFVVLCKPSAARSVVSRGQNGSLPVLCKLMMWLYMVPDNKCGLTILFLWYVFPFLNR